MTTFRWLLWLFVINLGVVFGAGLYEARVSVPRWVGAGWNADAARADDVGRRFWIWVTTVPLTLLTLASLIAALRSQGPLRTWWLAAAIFALADRLITFGYFVPTMIHLAKQSDSAAARAVARLWSSLNYGRLAIVLTAWLLAMRAFAWIYETRV